MKKSLLPAVSGWLLILATVAVAQGVTRHLDPAVLYHLDGTVQSLQLVPGEGKPSLVLALPDGTVRTVQLAP